LSRRGFHSLKFICLSLPLLTACQHQSEPDVAIEPAKADVAPPEKPISAPAAPVSNDSSEEFSEKEMNQLVALVRESGDDFPILEIITTDQGAVEVWTGEDDGPLTGNGICHLIVEGKEGWFILSSDPWDK
jgi:hypothetical protein